MRNNLINNLKESLQAVLPIGGVIVILHFTVAPMPIYTLALMLVGLLMLVFGLTLFSMGTEMAMMPMGEQIGSTLIRNKKMSVLVIALFAFGAVITAAEPDLQVFAIQVASIPNNKLIIGIAVGVGVFLVLSALRVLFRWQLSRFLLVMYIIVFSLAAISPDYISVALDASAVTTGPITVPFLLAIGAGFSAISSSKDADEDNFGLCGICSIGPIIAVLVLGFFYDTSNNDYLMTVETATSGREVASIMGKGLYHTLGEVAMVVIPIVVIFIIFQITKLKLSKTELVKIGIGLAYLLVGLTIFLAGVNKGFMPAAKYLGEAMGALEYNWILIPLCFIIGACVVIAEPAVHVLNKQVEDITSGAISKRLMLFGMALGVGLAFSLAMVRMLFGIAIWWIIIPGYIISLSLSFRAPKIFVGIGFDSGGVAAGAMSAAFVLPFTIGVCTSVGGNPITDAFGVVGLIAMMPPITVQLMGVIYSIKLKKATAAELLAEEMDAAETECEDEENTLTEVIKADAPPVLPPGAEEKGAEESSGDVIDGEEESAETGSGDDMSGENEKANSRSFGEAEENGNMPETPEDAEAIAAEIIFTGKAIDITVGGEEESIVEISETETIIENEPVPPEENGGLEEEAPAAEKGGKE